MTKFKDKNILITGGASGLGRLLAIESAKRNTSNIILLDINEKGLRETKKILEDEHLEKFLETAEKDIIELYKQIKGHCKVTMSSALKFDNT